MTSNMAPAAQRGFPILTAAAVLAAICLFAALTWLAANASNPLMQPTLKQEDAEVEPVLDPAAKLDELTARNNTALAGIGAKMSRQQARKKLLEKLKGPNDTLPFPTPEPPTAKQ